MNKVNKKREIVSITLIIIFILILIIISFTKTKNKTPKGNMINVKLNEVVRSVFYAPMYVSINEGFFEEEGIKIDLSTGQGADKTMQQVLSGTSDIGFCGPEQVIYIYNQKKDDMPIIFAQLTQTDGAFLVGRNKEKNFKWDSLKGKSIIGGRPGGVPEMTLEYVLKQNGINPKKDIKLITNLDFTATSGAFKAGTGDYVSLFEPTASALEKDGSGYIVSSIGNSAGSIAYTCFFTTKSYMDKNPEIIEHFTKAIYKGQKWLNNHSDKEVATSIKSFFPGIDEEILINVLKNYRTINAYASDPLLKEEDLNNLMDIIQDYDESLIKIRPPFNKIVNNSFAKKALK